MKKLPWIATLVLAWIAPVVMASDKDSTVSTRFKSLNPPTAAASEAWRILERDGANRKVEPYLSSLAQGESGTGAICSAPFVIKDKSITFTIRGHDGQGGGQGKNFIALVDNQSGETLMKTAAPGVDVLQERTWNTGQLIGRKVRIEIHDGIGENAFAWLGVGTIDAGESLRVDFRKGMPEEWHTAAPPLDARTELLTGGIPFRKLTTAYTMIPTEGAVEVPCGFQAKRLFILGGTISTGRPLETCGWVEIIYEQGASDRFPLMIGFTLDGEHKLLSPSKAVHLHPSSDPFQYYLVIHPRQETIQTIKLARNAGADAMPRITAITCETEAFGGHLRMLPKSRLSTLEETWIQSHALSADSLQMHNIESEIRRSHQIEAVTFDRVKISDRTFEAASVCDVDNDGNKDIVSGGYWYAGPRFAESHIIRDVLPAGEYWDDFSDYPMDVNGDGFPDIVTGAFFGRPLQWIENPGGAHGPWKTHDIEPVGPIETIRFWDVDGDGIKEVVPNAGGNVIFFRLVVDSNGKGTGKFTKHVVKIGECGHGLGFGDVNGDGRGDFVVPNGWIESPEKPLSDPWIWHSDFQLGTASVPTLVHDVNEDGKADLIVGQAHGYGLDWLEQGATQDGKRTWIKHPIDAFFAQYHDMMLADIDNDGEVELITGKRYRAHNGHDPGSTDPLFIRYYEIEKSVFSSRTIDYGSPKTSSGVGIYFWVEDIDGDGWKDIIAPGKEGLYLFRNRGR